MVGERGGGREGRPGRETEVGTTAAGGGKGVCGAGRAVDNQPASNPPAKLPSTDFLLGSHQSAASKTGRGRRVDGVCRSVGDAAELRRQ